MKLIWKDYDTNHKYSKLDLDAVSACVSESLYRKGDIKCIVSIGKVVVFETNEKVDDIEQGKRECEKFIIALSNALKL